MSNDYYNASGWPITLSLGASANGRSEMASIQAGFDKMVGLTGNGGKFVRVNSGATAQEAVSTTGSGNVVLATAPVITGAQLQGTTLIGNGATDYFNALGGTGSVGLNALGGSATVDFTLLAKGTSGGVYLWNSGGKHFSAGAGYGSVNIPDDWVRALGSWGAPASPSLKTSSRGLELTAGNGVVGIGGQPSTGTTPGGLQILGSIKGIYLGNGANSDGAVLDWYEEGVFTPALTAATPGDLSVAYALQVGRFTRIGNRVFVNICITTSAFTHTTASGAVEITGLPYTSKNLGGSSRNVGVVDFSGFTKANYASMVALVPENSAIVFLEASGTGQAAALLSITDFPSGGTVVIHTNFSYEV